MNLKNSLEKIAKTLLVTEIKMKNPKARMELLRADLLSITESLQALRRELFFSKGGRLDTYLTRGERNDAMRLDAMIQLVFIDKATTLLKKIDELDPTILSGK